jgi:hypothetical protein
MKAHRGQVNEDSPFKYDLPSWMARGGSSEVRCTYCGSMTPQRAIELLRTAGTTYSGCDWKYGWPHKFYIQKAGWKNADDGPGKFYSEHLLDCDDAALAEFNELSRRLLGVSFTRDEKGLKWGACRAGWQTWGTVGVVPTPEDLSKNTITFGPPVPEGWDVRATGAQSDG